MVKEVEADYIAHACMLVSRGGLNIDQNAYLMINGEHDTWNYILVNKGKVVTTKGVCFFATAWISLQAILSCERRKWCIWIHNEWTEYTCDTYRHLSINNNVQDKTALGAITKTIMLLPNWNTRSRATMTIQWHAHRWEGEECQREILINIKAQV